MVLGLRTKNRKGISVQVDYLIQVQEIKPWPPSQSLRSVQSVWLQWENGDQSSGSFISSIGDGKVEFCQSFRLPVSLRREASRKGTAPDSFQKNCLEFYLYEPRKDKAVKGQLLGSAVLNIADYGIIKETVTISTPINFKKSSKNMMQPVLYVNIQPFDKDSSSSSPQGSLSKEMSLDKDGSESVSDLMNEGNDGESEIASITDDEDDGVSSCSSRTISSCALETGGPASQNVKNVPLGVAKDGTRRVSGVPSLLSGIAPADPEVNPMAEASKHPNESSSPLLMEKLSSGLGNPADHLAAKVSSSDVYVQVSSNSNDLSFEDSYTNREEDRETLRHDKNGPVEATTSKASSSDVYVGLLEDKGQKEQQEKEQAEQILELKKDLLEDKLVCKLPQDATRNQVKLRSNTLAFSRTPRVQGSAVSSDKLKHLKSVQLHFDSAKSNGLSSNSQFMEKAKEINSPEDVLNIGNGCTLSEREQTTNGFSDDKIELLTKIEMLEEELREAAAVEVGLYSVVAEHGSSTNKVHAPARRLSRFYFHACKAGSQAKRASAAKAVVSGLALVSKACGNDVPRLTFWLSNSIVLRAIVSQAVGKLQLSSGPSMNKHGGGKGSDEKFTPKWLESSPPAEENSNTIDRFDDCEDPQTIIVALEKVEAWIFSRIVESVWWQTLTPHMQSTAVKGSSSRKTYARRYGLGDQEQGNFAIDLWKKAFKDACERLCPIRAGGHECGCLPVLARLVMEQLVSRLDVAMFNAILRESADEMPTDPVSDPISDSKVLPIPAGKSSFGAGAQLKNAVGNWSRWLSDLFGIDDNDCPEVKNELDDKRLECETSFKAFELLNALSDLMMLPFEMLADESTRKEVCPIFGAPLIKRILYNFVPDEFSPDPIPEVVLEALDSEDLPEHEKEAVTSFPCMATPTVYSPPAAASLTGIIGEVGNQTLMRSGSTLLKKSYTSDDELDELDSPLSSIIIYKSRASPTSAAPNRMPTRYRKVVRYQLLREVWRDGE